MAVISPREEQLFQEITGRLARPRRIDPLVDIAFSLRRPALILVWIVSLLGAFGGVEGRVPMVACAMSLAFASFAIWSDFIASPDAWETHT